MLKIVFLNRSLMSGGIEKCIELLTLYLNKNHEIEILYLNDDKLDENMVKILSRYAKVSKLEGQIIKCDVCIFCYLYFDYNKIINQILAKKYWCWIHSKPRELPNCILDNKKCICRTSEYICVSNEVLNKLNIEKQGIVIHNFIDPNIKKLADEKVENTKIEDDILKLVVVSRLSKGKGFERVEKLVKTLEERNIPYRLQIIGKGRAEEEKIRESLGKYKGVEFLGYQENPYKYIKQADYLLQLSDYETWGNAITESKAIGIPCIVTNFPVAKEQIEDEKNGIIVPLELENYNFIIDKAIKMKKTLRKNLQNFKYDNEIEKWEQLLLSVSN